MDTADEASFSDFAAARLVPLRKLGYLVGGDWHLAEDAASTVLEKLYLSWHRIRATDNVDAYVRRMLVRAVVDERRRPWRRESPAEHPLTEPAHAGRGTDTLDDRLVLREALARMPPRRRAVLVLRFFEALSVEETAATLGCTTGTVKSQTARGPAALRDLLPDDYLGERGGA